MTSAKPVPLPDTSCVGVVGLGVVGLQLAVAVAARFSTVGVDDNAERVRLLQDGQDLMGLVPAVDLHSPLLRLTTDVAALGGCDVVLITVPVVLDPPGGVDVSALTAACAQVGAVMRAGALVLLESTGWPGLTEQHAIPALERASGLRCGRDFHVGYSPERINPADAQHGFSRTAKVVSGWDARALERALAFYGAVVDAPLHAAPSIRVAEAAKLVENAQRDLNIALANELSFALDRMGLSTREVFSAAATKWNFAPYAPGLVGGACVGLAPRLLEHATRQAGGTLSLLAAGRTLHAGMVPATADRLLRLLARAGIPAAGARVGVVGCTYKADVADVRHSRVPELVAELTSLGMVVRVADPVPKAALVLQHQGIPLVPLDALVGLDALILAVNHTVVREQVGPLLTAAVRPGGVVMDLAWMVDAAQVPEGITLHAL